MTALFALAEISKKKQADGEWVYTKGINAFVDDLLFPKEEQINEVIVTEDADFEIVNPKMIEAEKAKTERHNDDATTNKS